jgi:hypothetical protein
MYMNIAAIERVWEAHAAAEFVSADVDATMATMTRYRSADQPRSLRALQRANRREQRQDRTRRSD